jgi:hypothetical protein
MASYFTYLKEWLKRDKEAQLEAVKRLGLPANNTAQDRARFLGFDLDNIEYHTTDLDGKLGIEADGFINFDKQKNFFGLDQAMKKAGKSDRDRYLTLDDLKDSDFDANGNLIGFDDSALRTYYNKGTYTSDEPFISEMTAQVSPLDSRYTFPLVVNKSKHFDYNNPDHVKDLMTPRPDKSTWTKMYDNHFPAGEVNPLDLERIQKGQHNVMEDFMTQMNIKKRGYTGTNMKEPESYVGNRATTTVTFKPELFRSPLAHFNPKYAGVGAGSILSKDLMADELDLEYKPKPSMFKGLMETIGNVNQQQAQAYGDTGASVVNGVGSLLADPSVMAEVAVRGMAGLGLGGLLMSNDVASAEDPRFLQRLR